MGMVENDFEANIVKCLLWAVVLSIFILMGLAIKQVNYISERGQGFKQEAVFIKHETLDTRTDNLKIDTINKTIKDK